MLGLLPAVFVAACAAALAARWGRSGAPRPGRRDTIALALLVAGAWSAAGAELLSLGRMLEFGPVLIWWALPTAAMAGYALVHRDALRDGLRPPARPDRVTGVLIAIVAVFLVATGLVGLLTPPNTSDAAGYHMARQVYWTQQGGMAHYPANDLRQLEFPPMAETAGVQVMILSGGSDRWANMVQWAAYLGCVLVASAIARDLGAGARGQALAALLATTYPPSVNHALNVKNDLVITLWICLLAWFAVRLRTEGTCRPGRAAVIGLALGLALYTHGVGYVLVLPLIALLGVWMLSRLGPRAVVAAILIGVVAAGVNTGHWWRNYDAFGHPLGRSLAGRGFNLTNDTMSPAALASGIIRNLALHTGTPSDRVNSLQNEWITRVHNAAGIDASDPRTTAPPRYEFAVRWALTEDAHGGAPVHLLLALVAPVGLAGMAAGATSRARWRLETSHSPGDDAAAARRAAAWGLLATGWLMFLLFSVVFKWQPWHTRLHMPMFTLAAPVCALVMSRAPGGLVKGVLVLGCGALAAGAMIGNVCKPLIGPSSVLARTREQILFQIFPEVLEPMRAAVAAAAELRPRVVAVDPGSGAFEYPMQRLLLDHLEPSDPLRPGMPVLLVPVRSGIGPARPQDAPIADAAFLWDATSALVRLDPAGPAYVPVAQFLPITVYAREDLVQRRRRDIEVGLPFSGWRDLEGLGPPEGPLPQWNIPVVVRCGTGSRTRLRIEGGTSEAELVLECRRGPSPGRIMEVFLNDERVYRFEFGAARRFTEHRVPLRPLQGPSEVEIRYSLDSLSEPGPGVEPPAPDRAVIYRRLQVAPRIPSASTR